MGNEKKWITTAQAAVEFGVTQRYIQFLCCGRKRMKGRLIWYVSAKLTKIKYARSVKNRQMILIDRQEIKELFTKEHSTCK